MRNSFLWFFASILFGVWPFGAAAQGVAEPCVQRGLLPGSAAYHACLTASQESAHGMFDPLKPENPEPPGEAPGAEDGGTMSMTKPDDPLIELDPLDGDRGRSGSSSAGWDWSQTRK
jgi:hypothetical protein